MNKPHAAATSRTIQATHDLRNCMFKHIGNTFSQAHRLHFLRFHLTQLAPVPSVERSLWSVATKAQWNRGDGEHLILVWLTFFLVLEVHAPSLLVHMAQFLTHKMHFP